jgi:hypothetical protein
MGVPAPRAKEMGVLYNQSIRISGRGVASITAAVVLAITFGVAIPATGAWASVRVQSTRSISSSKPKPPTTKQIESELGKLASSAGAESKATFDLTYEYKNSTSSGKVTLAQKPPDQVFDIGSGELLYNGKTTYYCSLASAVKTCISYKSSKESPLGVTMGIYESSAYVDAMKTWAGLVESKIAGYHVSFSSKTIDGQPSSCVDWSYKGASDTYCVTDKGVLAYVAGTSASGTFTFTLTKFSSSVSSSTFSLPKSAKIISVPT